jgi:hypothetical protein
MRASRPCPDFLLGPQFRKSRGKKGGQPGKALTTPSSSPPPRSLPLKHGHHRQSHSSSDLLRQGVPQHLQEHDHEDPPCPLASGSEVEEERDEPPQPTRLAVVEEPSTRGDAKANARVSGDKRMNESVLDGGP